MKSDIFWISLNFSVIWFTQTTALVEQLLGGVSARKGHLFHDSNIRKGSDAERLVRVLF